MSNLVKSSVELRNALQHSNWNIEEMMRLYCKTNKELKFEYNTSSDFGCLYNTKKKTR